jgi:hypothetical protein
MYCQIYTFEKKLKNYNVPREHALVQVLVQF